jgi:phenylalanyl-tRNA synthetase beta chain
MRTTLLVGLLEAVARARRFGEHDVRLFSAGSVFLAPTDGELPEERPSLTMVTAGDRAGWLHKPGPVDVWEAKGLAETLVHALSGRAMTLVPADAADAPHLHPRGAAIIRVQDTRVGVLGPLHPDVADAFDTGSDVMVVELDMDALAKVGKRTMRYAPIARFPAATRDIAVVVKDGVPAGDVGHAVREAAGALAERVALFDRFAGGPVPAGHVSLAFHVVYRAADRTLTDVEVDAAHAKVVVEVGKRFGATLRA